jgi:uncharacterized membrane protein
MSRSWVAPSESTATVTRRQSLPTDAVVERQIGWVLRGGVAVAGAIILVGLVLFFVQEIGRDRVTLDAILGRNGGVEPVRAGSVLDGLIDGRATALIRLGLLVLILTPIARVALTVMLFRRQRDRVFTFLAGTVFIVLLLGLIGIGA